ncbi:polysaccharide biosynthesis tyrosine autokinase [Paraburkholderia sp. J11-2]|uniref:polysaccharide biosynthesis tyrosine autokinase n=1 Tax=Paraburkholderia sp. J11-2 TaxID=2805431 RepID=UPI002AB6A448|nr:polysaccharide biosynthesis tyrosine autokinase [Paraburkholderia sp. J11-2]
MISSQKNVADDNGSASNEIQLAEYVAAILEHWKLIAVAIAISLLLGVVYIVVATPQYRADAMIQVEDDGNSSNSALGQLASIFDNKQTAAAEMALIGSRLVVGGAVNALHLDVTARPRYFPLIGRMIARHAVEGGLASPVLGMTRYAWGGEKIEVSRFDVAESRYDDKYTLVAREGGAYDIVDPDGELVLQGHVGQLATTSVGKEPISIKVDRLIAHAGTHFVLKRSSTLDTIGDLQQALVITELAKDSGIIGVSLDSDDASHAALVINTIASMYVQQNVDRKSAEAQHTLKFLDDTLPQLRQQLNDAESQYNAFRNQRGTVDLSQEGQLLLQRVVDSKTKLLELQQKRTEMVQRFTASHPAVAALDGQIAGVTSELDQLSKQVTALPNTEQTALQLLRDVRVDTELYMSLLNSAQQLRILKAGQVGSVRIVDYAVVQDLPVKPKKLLVLLLSIVAGSFIGTAIVFIRRSLSQGVTHSEEIERSLGLPVYAMIPHSDAQNRLEKQVKRDGRGIPLLAVTAPGDVAVEAIRSLRTALEFAMLNAANNVISITSSRPGAGKSFTSANLAAVLASSGKRVMLIDADLRRGTLQSYFGIQKEPGVTDVILRGTEVSRAVVKQAIKNVDVLPRGTSVPNPSELLMSDRMRDLVDRFSREYDVVIVDTPPVLAVTDSAVVGKLSGMTLLAIQHGAHPMPELMEVVQRLHAAGVSIKGALFTNVAERSLKAGAYYTAYYAYDEKAGR